MAKIDILNSYFDEAKIPSGRYAFDTEDSVPVLYKYVSSERISTCLPEVGDGTLRATQLSALNDPFESAVCKVFVEANEEDGNATLSSVLTDLNPTTSISAEDVAEARRRHGNLFYRELLSRQLSKRFGIVAFATCPFNPLMWSLYTGDGSGFVIGYDMTELIKLSSRKGGLRPVDYHSKPTFILGYEVLNEENINALLSFKSDLWSHEKEWRLIVNLNETIGTGYSDQRGQPISLLRIPNEAVVRVFCTERTPPDVVDKVWKRLEDPNNRFGAENPERLVQSEDEYGYQVKEESNNCGETVRIPQ